MCHRTDLPHMVARADVRSMAVLSDAPGDRRRGECADGFGAPDTKGRRAAMWRSTRCGIASAMCVSSKAGDRRDSIWALGSKFRSARSEPDRGEFGAHSEIQWSAQEGYGLRIIRCRPAEHYRRIRAGWII